MNFPFSIKPVRWIYYLNPFWWYRKRKVEIFLAYVWDKEHVEEKINIAIKEAVLYGEGKILFDGVQHGNDR